jgi:ATP phosphoribosyltransferase
MSNGNGSRVRLALPSKGELEKPTLSFLAAAGLEVYRPNQRQYVASIPAVPEVEVLFQRAADIVNKVEEGSVDLGVTGFDIVSEQGEGSDNTIVMAEDLGYGRCALVLAVPESWVDVTSVDDLGDLAIGYKEQGRALRIATKYANLTRRWLYERGIVHFSLTEAQGALEAAPSLGYADLIADLTSSGTTLRENRLKRIRGGTILPSQACLIGNRERLLSGGERLHVARTVLELIEARRRATKHLSVTANVPGASAEAVAHTLLREHHLPCLRGPSIVKVYSKHRGDDDWYAATVVVEQGVLLDTVDRLRKAGGTDITVTSPEYLFDSASWTYEGLVERLERGRHS